MTTVSIEYRAVRVWTKFLVNESDLSNAPTDRVRAPKAADVPPPIFTADELHRLLEAAFGQNDT